MAKDDGNSVGLLSFMGGTRKIGVSAEGKKEGIFSNMFPAIRWTFMLSMLLWWIPIVGQATAGYIGGRTAGTPARGMVATLLVALALIGITIVLSSGVIAGFDFLNTDPGEAIAAIGMDFPLLGWILEGILWVLQGVCGTVLGSTSMKVNIYIITIVFGLIGGLTADMHRKEVVRSTPDEGKRVFMPRSLAAYLQGKKLGFGNFDDQLSMQASKVPEQKVVTIHKTLIRKPSAREEPAALPAADAPPAAQEAEQRDSPFAGLIHRAEKNDPEKERVRHSASKDDLEYV
ncbi:MAG: hypothetical protein LBV13_01535 [Methanomassiliicoccaceae archaeon]|nr:hypothetical protein [Methanomassiliicoccaceae archaeon]